MLTGMQKRQFEADGFVVLDHIVPEAQLVEVERALSARLDELAGYYGTTLPGRLAGLNEKMLALEAHHAGACLTFTHSHIISPALFALWSSGPLLEIAKALIGPDVDGHPFLSVRPKPPSVSLFNVPWHQDSAYLQQGAQHVRQVSMWIPLMDASLENGCMEYARGVHRQGRELPHRAHEYTEYGNTSWYVEILPEVAENFDAVACEIPRGSCIVFGALTPHRSLPNRSPLCRWSIDFRYLEAGGFAGTQQNPIPFCRQDAQEARQTEQQKHAYLAAQNARDRHAWRHRVERAVWKERWMG